jgi:hypothetical protein
MSNVVVATLVTLDGVMEDPGGAKASSTAAGSCPSSTPTWPPGARNGLSVGR